MIGWLQGEVREAWQQASRYGVLLAVGGIGYEVQLSRRQFAALPAAGTSLELHIHQAFREDGWSLFGFGQRQERELFRELVAVSGVGPQVALGLLGELEPAALVRAIVDADLRRLAQAPGVGKRTAERLAVELRSRLQQRFASWAGGPDSGLDQALELAESAAPDIPAAALQEVRLTLEALGYESLEIQRALRVVAAAAPLAAGAAAGSPAAGGAPAGALDAETCIRECLRWLSRDAA